jgi:mannosyltransferase OCH1-like enzyme
MNIFQVFICDDEWLTWNLEHQENFFAEKRQKILDVFPDANYQLFSNDLIKEFLFEFDKEAFDCYNTLKPYAFRADLVRYCLLYKFGGWYFDLSVKVINKFVPTHDYVIFQNPKFLCIENCVLYSRPSTIFFDRLIEQALSNVKNKGYGKDSLSITGPMMIKDVFNKHDKHDKKNNFFYGQLEKNDERGDFFVNKGLFAEYCKTLDQHSTIEYMGFKGTNNYNKLYKERNVFNVN